MEHRRWTKGQAMIMMMEYELGLKMGFQKKDRKEGEK